MSGPPTPWKITIAFHIGFYRIIADDLVNRWHIDVNISKTMVIVFKNVRNGGSLRSYEQWKFSVTYLHVATYYKYLRILLSSRNTWYVCQKTLANQASEAWFEALVCSKIKTV